MNIQSSTKTKTIVTSISNSNIGNHTHGIPGQFNGKNWQMTYPTHAHIYSDASASYTVNHNVVSIQYEKGMREVSIHKEGHFTIASVDETTEIFGDIIAGMIQEGGDIELFKAMLGEKLKEIIKEFNPGGDGDGKGA